MEYKESVHSLSDSVFETVSSFSNRYGGYILLGVKEVKRGNKKIGYMFRLVRRLKSAVAEYMTVTEMQIKM